MNQNLSTQIPQIGDSSQQLLARMAAAAADQNQILPQVTWLSSASRTTAQDILLTAPAGAVGIKVRVLVTAVNGIDTLRLQIWDSDFYHVLAQTDPTFSTMAHVCVLKTGCFFVSPAANPNQISAGIHPSFYINVSPSGANPFTYSATFQWIKD